MCSAPAPSPPPAIQLPEMPKPPPPPPVPVVAMDGKPYAGVIRKTAVQKGAKRLAARGPSSLRIPLPKAQ